MKGENRVASHRDIPIPQDLKHETILHYIQRLILVASANLILCSSDSVGYVDLRDLRFTKNLKEYSHEEKSVVSHSAIMLHRLDVRPDLAFGGGQ
jgi:hypothetical protein